MPRQCVLRFQEHTCPAKIDGKKNDCIFTSKKENRLYLVGTELRRGPELRKLLSAGEMTDAIIVGCSEGEMPSVDNWHLNIAPATDRRMGFGCFTTGVNLVLYNLVQ